MCDDQKIEIFDLLHQIIQCSNQLSEIEPSADDEQINDCLDDGRRLVEILLSAIKTDRR